MRKQKQITRFNRKRDEATFWFVRSKNSYRVIVAEVRPDQRCGYWNTSVCNDVNNSDKDTEVGDGLNDKVMGTK